MALEGMQEQGADSCKSEAVAWIWHTFFVFRKYSNPERSRTLDMLGFLFNERECRELDYVLRKELDEMLFDLNDKRIDSDIKTAIESRYRTIFRMYARLASPKEISRYARNRMYH
ncbi:hypothetical protein SAMN02799630_05750 [Paenibacillus sp. UNCCL117]|nr:hypothetical protein SAMN04488602_1342 [Paenibacillus sp. cl123]SFW68378.1 hypothetical protein SAMN02799630_05750 [Paenibacillus sp. UNCCL117]